MLNSLQDGDIHLEGPNRKHRAMKIGLHPCRTHTNWIPRLEGGVLWGHLALQERLWGQLALQERLFDATLCLNNPLGRDRGTTAVGCARGGADAEQGGKAAKNDPLDGEDNSFYPYSARYESEQNDEKPLMKK